MAAKAPTLTKEANAQQMARLTGVKPLVGMSVFVFDVTQGGLTLHYPGIIVEVQPEQVRPNVPSGRVNVSTYHSRNSKYPAVYPVDNVVFCPTDDALRQAAAQGVKWVCRPYDPANTIPYQPLDVDTD